jgi:hypothetical protein
VVNALRQYSNVLSETNTLAYLTGDVRGKEESFILLTNHVYVMKLLSQSLMTLAE